MNEQKSPENSGENDDLTMNQLEELLVSLVQNAVMTRQEFLDSRTDRQRVMDRDCGYPQTIQNSDYVEMFERDAIGSRVVEVLPKESWQVSPEVYETEEEDDETEFERRFNTFATGFRGQNSWFKDDENHPLWRELQQLDIVSRVLRYGVMLLGVNDGLPLDQPVNGWEETGSMPIELDPNTGKPVEQQSQQYQSPFISPEFADKPTGSVINHGPYSLTTNALKPSLRKEQKGKDGEDSKYYDLMYVRCFREDQAQITKRETNRYSPRFGMPTEYQLTLKNTLTIGIIDTQTFRVHWSRVILVADNTYGDPYFGEPALRCVYNDVLDAKKVVGAGAEGYKRMGIPSLSFESNPNLGPNVKVNLTKMKQMVDRLQQGMERNLFLTGMTAKPISVPVPDPTPFHNLAIERICIKLAIPVPVFKGYEIGEQASTNNDSDWNDRLRNRQRTHLTYGIIAPTIDRLIDIGVLPEPETGMVCLKWPPLSVQSESEKAQILTSRTQALSTYASGNASSVMGPHDYLTKEFGLGADEATKVLDNVEPLQPDPNTVDPTMDPTQQDSTEPQ